MSLYNGPARGGNRGGKDAFNWDQVKNDPHRDYYLGHSVKAAVGRWQNGKDILWYTREKGTDEEEKARQELLAVKQREEDLMAEALGIKPRQIKQPSLPKLDQQDMAQLLQRNLSGEDEGDEDPEAKRLADADRMKGLGYLPHAMTGGEQAEHEVMAGVNTGNPGPHQAAIQQEAPGSSRQLPSAQELALIEEARAVQERQKRKAEKKEKKKAKEKEAKHEKKRHKHRDHSEERSHKRHKH